MKPELLARCTAFFRGMCTLMSKLLGVILNERALILYPITSLISSPITLPSGSFHSSLKQARNVSKRPLRPLHFLFPLSWALCPQTFTWLILFSSLSSFYLDGAAFPGHKTSTISWHLPQYVFIHFFFFFGLTALWRQGLCFISHCLFKK